jgi:hypothetical protein
MRTLSALLAAAILPSLVSAQIALDDKERFSAPGFLFLNFHNNYQVGNQGGLQMFQNGERLLDTGDLFLVMKNGEQPPSQNILRRTVDRVRGESTVHGRIESGPAYRIVTGTDGKRIRVRLELDQPLDPSRFAAAGFRLMLYPGAYYSHSYVGDSASGVFPRNYPGHPVLLDSTARLTVAPEEPRYAVTITREKGSLRLTDERISSPQRWFTVTAALAPSETSVDLWIQPTILSGWKRTPVIGVSQAGYHPNQTKRAVIELDARETDLSKARLVRLGASNETVLESAPSKWGPFHSYQYAVFDFSSVKTPGVYMIEYAGQRAGPFRIAADVLETAWRPTLQYFFPIQMCHAEIREGSRVWHGACHLDDAAQAPAGRRHLDGYEQAARETPFADDQHVPGLDWGGWHDAGDHDVPAGSVARTMQALALAWEEFRPDLDETSIDRTGRRVLLHKSDGQPDILQQVEHAVEWLTANYAAAGHMLAGVIERTRQGYGHLGDMSSVTDNRVNSPGSAIDDRWVFTNRNTGLQYLTAETLAIASRVLKECNPALAARALEVAGKLWEFEQSHPPVYARNAYVPRDSGYSREEIGATAELFLTTGDARFRSHLLSFVPAIARLSGEQFGGGPGWTLVRTLDAVKDPAFEKAVRESAARWKTLAENRAKASPYGVLYMDEVLNPGYKLEARSGIHSGFVWGHGWNLQSDAMRQYYLHKRLPEMFSAEPIFNTVNFVLGCHPATNESFVSGVGAHSTLAAYGYNRADWSNVPGGVISGTSLIKPDVMELKTFPFLWYQTEYVIHGGATYIFDVLAAQHLLKK